MRKLCAILSVAAVLGCSSAPPLAPEEGSRNPASVNALLDCGQYENLDERKLCALAARQTLEAMGFFVESGILGARRAYVFRSKLPVPRSRYGVGPVASMAAMFTAGGASAMGLSSVLARRPGALANRLLESIAVTPIGVRGSSVSISLVGGVSGVSSSTFFPKPKVREENPGSIGQASMNFQLLFRKSGVKRALEKESEKDRAAAEVKFRAELGKIVQELVDKLSLLYLDDDQAERVQKAAINQLLDGFTEKGKLNESREVALDLVAILKGLGGDIEKKLGLLDELLREPAAASEFAKSGADVKIAIISNYSMLENDLLDLVESMEERDLVAAHGVGEKATAEVLKDEAEFLKNLKSFMGRVSTTRKLLRE